MYLRYLSIISLLAAAVAGQAQEQPHKFKQLKEELATPGVYRNAAGAPGHKYYQQRADYEIDLILDDKNQRIEGVETITYYNNSPDDLAYLWIQLDQNMRARNSQTDKISTGTIDEAMSFGSIQRMHNDFDGGFKIEYVRDGSNDKLSHTVVHTMMRIDLPKPLKSGSKTEIKIKYSYNINDRSKIGGRSGYEYFKDEDNYLYTIAQFYPRMAVYNETEGWQNKQFLGRGEFALTFGDYEVNITAPSDFVIGSTGVLQNASSVLTSEQRKRLDQARKSYDEPVMIVSPDEALENEKEKADGTKTWRFEAENVRDFAFAGSRKFIWDAMGVKMGDRTVLAMSYYPKEGNPLWERYSTKVVAHTLKIYSKHTFEYPYPVAISVHTDRIGMEYPMICFNGGRPEPDGTYSERTKYGMITVIIHEVGHNYFPMIVNSDERQWTWMDEGLNTFLQYLAEQAWEPNYPSRRGPAYKIADYMKGDKKGIVPIMTNSESILQFGNNAYGKPATALNILRETVLGRELFDFAFKTYAQRWMFKHPTPADFFRTMEDASGVDLDWFWRGWFYTTDHVDISIDNVKWYKVNTRNPKVENEISRSEDEAKPTHIGEIRFADEETYAERDTTLYDFYNRYDPFDVTLLDKKAYERYLSNLTDKEKQYLTKDNNYYQIDFSNEGGLVMPIILEFEYADGTKEVHRLPAEIWRKNTEKVSKVFITEKEVVQVVLDPFLEMADTDPYDNYFPRKIQPSRFKLYKYNNNSRNPMQLQRRMDDIQDKDE